MDIKIFSDLFSMGLYPLPLQWNATTKQAETYPDHRTGATGDDGRHTLNDVEKWLTKMGTANAIALKLHSPYFMFDFDLKNTEDKTVYDQWLNIVTAKYEDCLNKVCIERTRSGGYHVYAKHPSVSHKKMLACSSDGKEVISLYTGGLLSFCYPTPDYQLIHNDFTDIEELTDDEFDNMVSAAMILNKYTPTDGEYVAGEVIEYPTQYESTALQFDNKCSDELFEKILNHIDLFPVQKQRNKKEKFGNEYYLYLRRGSTAEFSAKVRFDRKRLFIFSGSFIKFPNFHTRINENDMSWRLTPTRIVFYSCGKDWQKTIDVIYSLCEEYEIEITKPDPVYQQKLIHNDRLKFPYDIFPESVQQFISAQTIQNEYLAGAILSAVSTTIGNSATLEAMPGYLIKPILYLSIVAPPGASKTPAIKKAFKVIEDIDNAMYKSYEEHVIEYKRQLTIYEQDKKNNKKPEPPNFPQTLIKDSTIEMVAKILTHNPEGCCLLADELVGFLKRMDAYKSGDDEQKWLEMWSGSSVLIQRITREVNKITEPFCGICGGIQPGVLESLSNDEKQHNGFYHRFLFVYPEPQSKAEWRQVFIPDNITAGFESMFHTMYAFRKSEKRIFHLSPEANDLYKKWFDFKNQYYNRSVNDNVKGIVAKYQDYCLRFALIIHLMADPGFRPKEIPALIMERAIRLTEYFLGNMNKAIKILAPETPVDKLIGKHAELYHALPASFSTKTLVTMGATFGLKPDSLKVFLKRQEGKLFEKRNRGEYEKMF